MKHTSIAIAALTAFALIVYVSPVLAQDNADAEYLSMEHSYELLKDGSTVYSYSHSLKYHTNYAFTRAYGESFIIYDPAWQKLTVTKSETTMRDGKKVSSPFNAYNEVLPGYAANAAPYLHLREMVVTHAGLEAGCTVDFGYTVATKKGFMPGLSSKVLFGARSPIRSLAVKVIVPAGTELRHAVLRTDIAPEKRSEAGKDVYTWRTSNLPLFDVEAFQPPMDEVLPVLLFSSASFSDLANHILSDGKVLQASAAMNALVAKQTEKSPTAREKALALRSWVADHVARMGAPLADIGARPLNAATTFDKRVGSDLDRAVLLTALCRAAKLDADVVLGSTDAFVAVPSALALPRALVIIRDASFAQGMMLLDPSRAPSGPAATMAGLTAYLPVSAKGGEPVLMSRAATETRVSVTSDWTLDKDMLVKGRSLVEAAGLRSHAFDPTGMQNAVKKALASAAQGLTVTPSEAKSGSDFTTSCDAEVSGKSALSAVNGIVRFAVPAAPGGITDFAYIPADPKRSTPVQLPAAMTEECRMTLHLPNGVTLLGGGGKIELQNTVGTVSSVIKGDSHDIEITRRITFNTDRVAPAQFEDLKALLSAWRDPKHTTLLLRVGG
jgi:hypothetical protein